MNLLQNVGMEMERGLDLLMRGKFADQRLSDRDCLHADGESIVYLFDGRKLATLYPTEHRHMPDDRWMRRRLVVHVPKDDFSELVASRLIALGLQIRPKKAQDETLAWAWSRGDHEWRVEGMDLPFKNGRGPLQPVGILRPVGAHVDRPAWILASGHNVRIEGLFLVTVNNRWVIFTEGTPAWYKEAFAGPDKLFRSPASAASLLRQNLLSEEFIQAHRRELDSSLVRLGAYVVRMEAQESSGTKDTFRWENYRCYLDEAKSQLSYGHAVYRRLR